MGITKKDIINKRYSLIILLLLIVNGLFSQTITTGSITQTSVCAGGNVIINYTTSGSFNTGCIFTAELSDGWGSFSNPVAIGSTFINAGIILGTIPVNTSFGILYRVRVVSNSPVVVGSTSPNPPIAILSNIITPTITITPNHPVCSGDSIRLSVQSNSSYLWSNGATTQSIYVKDAGSYFVKVTNLIGCESYSDTVAISVTQSPQINLGNDISFCGNSITINVGAGYSTYNWNDGLSSNPILTVTTSGIYYVEVTDVNQCKATDTIKVTVNQLPNTPYITQSHDTLYSTSPNGNQWYNNTSGLIQGATNNYYIPQLSGYYYDIVTLNGCSSDTSIIYRFYLNNINSMECFFNINIYPNPANDAVSIIFNNCKYKSCNYIIENVFKQKVYQNTVRLNNNTLENIDISHFASGIYFIKMNIDGLEKTLKLIVY